MRLRLSRFAIEDVESIYDYTVGEWGEEQAIKYVSGIWDALEELATTPERWRLRPEIYPECRIRICGKHLIIFRIRDGRVEISRILHAAMNLPDYLPTDFMGDS